MTFTDGGEFGRLFGQPTHVKMTQHILVGLYWQWAHNVLGNWSYKNMISIDIWFSHIYPLPLFLN